MKKTAVFLVSGLLMASAQAGKIAELQVDNLGGGVVDKTAVESYVRVVEGSEFDDVNVLRRAMEKDVKRLRDSGRFSYVTSEVRESEAGWTVIYRVKTRMNVDSIEVKGADSLRRGKVLSVLDLTEGMFTDDLAMAAKARDLKEYYRKHHYPYMTLDWRFEETGAQTRLVIQVTEGPKLKVSDIVVEGNAALTDKQIRSVMMQKETGLLSFFTGAGTYKPEETDADVAAIENLYKQYGYLDVAVDEPEVVDGKKLVVRIQEGSQYKLGSVGVSGNEIFSDEDIAALVKIGSGETASMKAVSETASAIEDYYGERGYLNTMVRPEVEAAEPLTADVSFEVREGRLAHINRIEIKGNTRTKDKVIRRELAVAPGEIYNVPAVKSSKRRLQNLGYFSSVQDIYTETAEPGKYDLTFQVEEQSTGQFGVGAGFSSVDSLVGFVEVSQGNFDIANWPPVGGGQKARLRAQLGTERTDFELSFTEPWFLDRKLALGTDLFHRESNYYSDDYDQVNTGGRVSLSKPLNSFDRITLAYQLEQVSIEDVDSAASPEIKAEEGDDLRSEVSVALTHDSRDRYLIPTKGNRTVLSAYGTGGPVGGDIDIYGMKAQSSQYWSPWLGHVVNVRGAVETVDDYSGRVPIYDRLFLGGQRSLRGFDYRDVGPVDVNEEPLGGKSSFYATVEYTVPVWSKIRWAVFYDFGFVNEKAYDFSGSNLNSDFGTGLRFDLPGFPLILDYAWPLQTDDHNDSSGGRFSFQIGYSF